MKKIGLITLGILTLTFSMASNAASWSTKGVGGFSQVHLYNPSSQSPIGNGKSLLIVLHGCTQAASAFKTANLNKVADEYGMVIAAPEAQYKEGFSCWGYWTGGISRTSKDYKNVITLATTLRDDVSYDIDPDQIYVAGLSSGGAFAMTVGCLAPDIFAGMGLDAAPSAGTSSNGAFSKESSPSQTASRCKGYAGPNSGDFTTQVTSTAYGTSDYTVPQGYGPQNADAMAIVYGVSKLSGTTAVLGNSGAKETKYTDSRVTMVEMSGVGHAWPGGSGASGSYVDGSSINYGTYLAEYFATNNKRADGSYDGGDDVVDDGGDDVVDDGGDDVVDDGGDVEQCYTESAYDTVTGHYTADRFDVNTFTAMGAEYGYNTKITVYLVNGSWTTSVDCLGDDGDGGSDDVDGGGQGGGQANGTWTKTSKVGFSEVHLYVPPTESPVGNGRSLMIVLHGCTQGASVFNNANLDLVGDEYGMVIAAPLAQYMTGYSCWGYWEGPISRTNKDYKNVIDLAIALRDDPSYGIDPDQIYVAGLSSGGAFAMSVGCIAPDVFAGMGLDAAPSAGTSSNGAFALESNSTQTAQRCEGYAGSNASYFDTQITSTAFGNGDYTVPQGYGNQNAEAMAKVYGVSRTAGTNTVTDYTGETASENRWSDGRISMVEFDGVGHAWPGGTGASGSYLDSSTVNYGMYLAKFFANNNQRIDSSCTDANDNGICDDQEQQCDDLNDNGICDDQEQQCDDLNDNGICDDQEPVDSDGDGVADEDDAFPNDPNETKDTDGDGVGDNADAYPQDPNRWEEECYTESAYGTATDHYIARRLNVTAYISMGGKYGYTQKFTLYKIDGTWTNEAECIN